MSASSPRRLLIGVAVLLLAVVGVGAYFWWQHTQLPAPGSPLYEQYAEAFEVGVAALDGVVPGNLAETYLSRAIELVPAEPAAWADRGLAFLRTNQFDKAAPDLEQAHQLAPGNPDIEKMLGLLDDRRGRYAEAAAHFRVVLEREPHDLQTIYQLAQELEKENKAGSDSEILSLLDKVLALRPNNLQVLLKRLELAIRAKDRAAVGDTVARMRRLAPGWSELAQSTLADLRCDLIANPGQDSPNRLLLSNLLRAEPNFHRDYAEVLPEDKLMGNSIQAFLRLAPLRNTPAPPGLDLRFNIEEPIAQIPEGRWDQARIVWLTSEGVPTVFVANSRELRTAGLSPALPCMPVSTHGIVALDWNNDFRTDLLVAGPRGLIFYQQQETGSFVDVTAKTGLPADVLHGDYSGAWAADVDLDGDLDIIVARSAGPPLLLRNNFDGTFSAQPIFPEVQALTAFAWADLDNDGAPDAALLDAQGRLYVYANERSGQFRPWPVAPPGDRFLDLVVMDANDDGVLDLVALRQDGALIRISDRNKRSSWDVGEIARWERLPTETRFRLLAAADLDNNGALDLIVSSHLGSKAWLGTGNSNFVPLPADLPPDVVGAADFDGKGRLDLVGLDAKGRPIRWRNNDKNEYYWQAIRPRGATHTKGDERINSFGIGGELELRTGTYVVKQPINAAVIHFGLGKRNRPDVLRITWPNGVVQAEFGKPIQEAILEANRLIFAYQRLTTSCPFLFTWNGREFDFVTDFLWSSPLGMYIQASDKGGFLQTTDWVKIRGDQLVPRDGYYEVRVNANLWETHFFDYLSLMAVDHPPGTELYVDERFFLEPTPPAFHLTEPLRPVANAWDHHGRDATAEVRAIDGVYLDRCGRGTYQGVTNDHWVEVDLGDDAPKEGPVWLAAYGFIHPTDSSINFALEQGNHDRPHALVLEVPDGKGSWKVGRDRLGFPAGKNKTVLIRLDGIDGPGVARRFRLRTNMEIFWDALLYGKSKDGVAVVQQQLRPIQADLRYRGVLEMTQANESSPELPHYDRVNTSGQPWRDLIGFHTRYGDVRELLEKIDDRYVIACAGDELVLRFPVPAGPQAGWIRDFVWIADGWVKDGNLNTRFGKTVLPLPAHDQTSYLTPPGRLEDDAVYRRHPKDWEMYHTRFVTPTLFEQGLRTFRSPRTETARKNNHE